MPLPEDGGLALITGAEGEVLGEEQPELMIVVRGVVAIRQPEFVAGCSTQYDVCEIVGGCHVDYLARPRDARFIGRPSPL